MTTGRLAGIVLAGGESRRMGRDKATLTVPGAFGGRSLLEQVLSVIAQRCDPVFVVAAGDQSLPDLPVRILRDEVPGLGPLPALAHGLRAAGEAGAASAFVCAVDMPYLTPDLIGLLGGVSARLGVDIVLPWAGRDHYLAGVYRTALAETVEALVAGGERRMGALVRTADTQRIVLADASPLANLNSPEDIPGCAP